jgi:hypothetical protein
MTVEFSRGLYIRTAADQRIYFQTAYDESKHTLKLTSGKQNGDFTYNQDAEHLILRGNLGGSPIIAGFHRLDESTFLLTSRGFHWISEYPFNR